MPAHKYGALGTFIKGSVPPWPSNTPNNPSFLSVKGTEAICASSMYILQPKLATSSTTHVRDRILILIALPLGGVLLRLGFFSEVAHSLIISDSSSTAL
jgi:hypothetical protein